MKFRESPISMDYMYLQSCRIVYTHVELIEQLSICQDKQECDELVLQVVCEERTSIQ